MAFGKCPKNFNRFDEQSKIEKMSIPEYSADDQLRSDMNKYEFDFDPQAMEHFQRMQQSNVMNKSDARPKWNNLRWILALFCLMGGAFWCYNEKQAPMLMPAEEKGISEQQKMDTDLTTIPKEEAISLVKPLPSKKKIEKVEAPPTLSQSPPKTKERKALQNSKRKTATIPLETLPQENLPSIPIKLEAVKDIKTIGEGERILLNNIQFEPGSPVMVPESKKEVELLLEKLQENPGLEIEISGHLCCAVEIREGDGYDYDYLTWDLSKNRAKKVYDFLVKKGIEKSRLSFQGMGLQKPLVSPEKSEEDEALNRRVEVKIIKQ